VALFISMKVYEVHRAIASSLTDPIEIGITGTTLDERIPDGVQYSRKLRSNYMDRAINKILSTYVQQIHAARVDDEADMCFSLFPTFTSNNRVNAPAWNVDREVFYPLPSSFVTPDVGSPLLILDCSYVWVISSSPLELTQRQQIPVLAPNEYNELVSRRLKTTHYADSIATYYGAGSGIRVYNSINTDGASTAPDYLELNYLPSPKPLEDHAWDDDVDFEAMYLGTAIQLAVIMGQIDAGGTNDQALAQSILPLIAKI